MPITVKSLNRTRANYIPNVWAKYRLLYAGGHKIQANASAFITKHAAEHKTWYGERLARFHYVNRVAPIIGELAGSVFQADLKMTPEKDGETRKPAPDFYGDLFNDPQGNREGTLADLMNECFVQALQDSETWLMLDFPEVPPDVVRSDRAQQETEGDLRAMLIPINAEMVLNYREDEDGLAAVMLRHRYVNDDMVAPVLTETICWRLIDRTSIRKWEITVEIGKEPKDDAEPTELPQIEHRLAKHQRVPMLCLKLKPHLWVMDQLGPLICEDVEKRNSLSWYETLACFPQLKHMGEETLKDRGAETDPAKRGVQYIWEIEKDGELDWLEIEGASLTHLAAKLEAIREDIQRTVHQMASQVGPQAAAQVQSAASKTRDSVSKRVLSEEYAKAIRRFAVRAWNLVALAREDDVTFEAAGLDRHDIGEAESAAEKAALAQGVTVRSETHVREVMKTFVREFHGEAEPKLIDAMLAEIDKADVEDMVTPMIMEMPGEDDTDKPPEKGDEE